MVLVSLLIGLNLYNGPLLWTLLSLNDSVMDESLATLCVLRAAQLLFALAVTTAQRYHLFVWTVFSPKVLYEANSALVFALISTIAICISKK